MLESDKDQMIFFCYYVLNNWKRVYLLSFFGFFLKYMTLSNNNNSNNNKAVYQFKLSF